MNKIVFGFEQFSVKGEDFACAFESVDGNNNTIYGSVVADGHGGDKVAKMAKTEIPKLFDCAIKMMDVVSSLKHIFQALQEKCITENSGCALTVCIIFDNASKVACANVGDVNAYLYQHGHSTGILLSTSHNFMDSPTERERVNSLGVELTEATNHSIPSGVLRAWPGGLAMGRSIGDSDCGSYVLSEPSISVTKIRSLRSVVICTDGVWNNLDSRQIQKRLEYNEGKPNLTAKSISGKAFSKNQSDDVTCFIMEPYVRYSSSFFGILPRSSDSSISLSSASSEEENDHTCETKTVLKVCI